MVTSKMILLSGENIVQVLRIIVLGSWNYFSQLEQVLLSKKNLF